MKIAQGIAHLRTGHRRLVLLLLAATPMLLSARCGVHSVGSVAHGWYSVTLANHSQRDVVITLLGRNWPMRPCSVQQHVLSGPTYQVPLEVEVKGESGRELAHWSISDRTGAPDPGLLHVRFPRDGSGECAPDNRDEFLVDIGNQLQQDVDLTLGGTHLGVVSALSASNRFGPIPRDWEERGQLVVRDSDGRVLDWGLDYIVSEAPLDYDLGEVPLLGMVVQRGWGR